MNIRKMLPSDWEQVKDIYVNGIRTGFATFEIEAPTSYDEWIQKVCPDTALVAVREQVIGWCKLSPISNRKVYAGVAEVSIYVDPQAKGKGVGSTLLKELIRTSEEMGFWTLQASIFPENKVSIYLHKKNGFREVGVREKIGKLNGVWHDNVILERRSEIVGTY